VGGLPFWQGTIPADTRPGPQTVYFLGKDQRGILATMVALYQVQPPPIVVTVQPGFTPIADNYFFGGNSLAEVLPNAADGTTIYKWDSAAQAYKDPYQFFQGFGWFSGNPDDPGPNGPTLRPGEGAFIDSPVTQTFTFTGSAGTTTPAPR